jgi:hypothetical protein
MLCTRPRIPIGGPSYGRIYRSARECGQPLCEFCGAAAPGAAAGAASAQRWRGGLDPPCFNGLSVLHSKSFLCGTFGTGAYISPKRRFPARVEQAAGGCLPHGPAGAGHAAWHGAGSPRAGGRGRAAGRDRWGDDRRPARPAVALPPAAAVDTGGRAAVAADCRVIPTLLSVFHSRLSMQNMRCKTEPE